MTRNSQSQSNRRSGSSTRKNTSSNKRRLSLQDQGFLDNETKRNIGGVCIIVLAIAIFVAVITQSNAVVTSIVSQALHLAFGIGSYLFPIFLVAIGVSFLYQSEREHVSGRVALGLLIVFIAILAILALFSPGSGEGHTDALFETDNLVSLGGYVGAGIAWVGITLFGQVISIIVMVGLIVLSVFIIGFSINDFILTIQEKKAARAERRREKRQASAQLPSASVQRAPVQPYFSFSSSDASVQKKPYTPATSLVGAGKKIKKPEGWVDPTLAELNGEDSQHAGVTSVLKESGKKSAGASSKKGSAASSVDFSAKTQLFSDPQLKDPEDVEVPQEDKPLTRKLGAKKTKDTEQSKKAAKKKTADSTTNLSVPAPQEGFELPDFAILQRSGSNTASDATEDELKETAELLQETLEDFGLSVQVKGWVAGPTVTLFKVALPSGVRVSRITVLSDDIALALAAPGVRIFAPIPGTNFVGIEVPNKKRQSVLLGDVLDAAPAGPLQMAIGKDVEGNKVVVDLAKAPHVLIGGTTGSGKSVGINSFIMSMLMRNTPSEVRMILIDPKRVEFTLYNGIPHLYIPVVEDPKDASAALNWGVTEMERRLKVFSSVGARNIGQFNTKVQSGELENEATMPYIVIVIDELADLMMNVGKEVEFAISRIAQLARAAGIHLIVATQRPSANVVTGLIKSNITTRMAFTVASGIDSRVILDTAGAENLTGYGDMLLAKPDLAKPVRIQGCYVSEDEINAVVEHLKSQGDPEYHSEILNVNIMSLGDTAPDGSGGKGGSDDPLIWEAADIVVSAGTASTSYIQRRLSVGYSRAGRIMDMLEEKGIVGPQNGSKARDVLVDAMELETLKAFETND